MAFRPVTGIAIGPAGEPGEDRASELGQGPTRCEKRSTPMRRGSRCDENIRAQSPAGGAARHTVDDAGYLRAGTQASRFI